MRHLRDPRTKVHQIRGISIDWPDTHNAAKLCRALRRKVCHIRFQQTFDSSRAGKTGPKFIKIAYDLLRTNPVIVSNFIVLGQTMREKRATKFFYPLVNCGAHLETIYIARPDISVCQVSFPFDNPLYEISAAKLRRFR